MNSRLQVIPVAAVFFSLFLISSLQASEEESTPAFLYDNAVEATDAAAELKEKGQLREAAEKYSTAVYLFEKIEDDFPDWKSVEVIRRRAECQAEVLKIKAASGPFPTPPDDSPVSCVWQMVFPGPDFKPVEEGIYRIELGEAEEKGLVFSFRKLEKFEGDVRICVQLSHVDRNTVLQDLKNTGLFRGDSGEFPLTLPVPSKFPLFLARYCRDQDSVPEVLSNIIETP